MDHTTQNSILGRGGYGVVRKVQYQGRTVAEKQILHYDQKLVEREIAFFKQLRHANLVEFIGHYYKENTVFILTEYYQLGNLAEFIFDKAVTYTVSTIVDWTYQLFDVLCYFKQSKVLHRDIKPQNVLLSHSFELKVCDLGLAKSTGLGSSYMSVGATPRYLPPEAFGEVDGKTNRYNFQSEVYSCGLLLWEAIERRHSYAELENLSILSRIMRLAKGIDLEPPKCRQVLEGLVVKSADHAPSNRPTCEENRNAAGDMRKLPFYREFHHPPERKRDGDIPSVLVRPDGITEGEAKVFSTSSANEMETVLKTNASLEFRNHALETRVQELLTEVEDLREQLLTASNGSAAGSAEVEARRLCHTIENEYLNVGPTRQDKIILRLDKPLHLTAIGVCGTPVRQRIKVTYRIRRGAQHTAECVLVGRELVDCDPNQGRFVKVALDEAVLLQQNQNYLFEVTITTESGQPTRTYCGKAGVNNTWTPQIRNGPPRTKISFDTVVGNKYSDVRFGQIPSFVFTK